MLFDTLCGVTKVASSSHIYLIGSGLVPGQTYYLFFESGSLTNDGSAVVNKVANANGYVVFDITQPGTTDFTYWMHDSSASDVAHRIANSVLAQWGALSPTFPVPSYGTPAVLGPVVGGDTIISVQWDPATGCDPRISSAAYTVKSDTFTPPTTTRVSGLTVTGWTETGRPNGTPRYYQVRSQISYVDDLITVGAIAPFYDSNIVQATPAGIKEAWGAIAS